MLCVFCISIASLLPEVKGVLSAWRLVPFCYTCLNERFISNGGRDAEKVVADQ
jgi:hypothetical protein